MLAPRGPGPDPDVRSVDVDLARKTVTVTGTVSRDAVRVAIDDAGYAVAA